MNQAEIHIRNVIIYDFRNSKTTKTSLKLDNLYYSAHKEFRRVKYSLKVYF
jgi:hypothetical protein